MKQKDGEANVKLTAALRQKPELIVSISNQATELYLVVISFNF